MVPFVILRLPLNDVKYQVLFNEKILEINCWDNKFGTKCISGPICVLQAKSGLRSPFSNTWCTFFRQTLGIRRCSSSMKHVGKEIMELILYRYNMKEHENKLQHLVIWFLRMSYEWYPSKSINELLWQQIWQKVYFRSYSFFKQTVDYIHRSVIHDVLFSVKHMTDGWDLIT